MSRPKGRYRVLQVKGPKDKLDQVLARLEDEHFLGVEESSSSCWKFFFSEDVEESAFADTFEHPPSSVTFRWLDPVRNADWAESLRSSFRGVALGERFYVLPSWQAQPETENTTERHVLRIDPEQAFGTGTHESTALAAEALERIDLVGRRVIDVGTGSGILAMVAALLGASNVLALEPDPAAADCARANVTRNELASSIRIEPSGFESFARLEADVIVANLYGALLERALPRFRCRQAIVAGLLTSELSSFETAIPDFFRIAESSTRGEWAALVLESCE